MDKRDFPFHDIKNVDETTNLPVDLFRQTKERRLNFITLRPNKTKNTVNIQELDKNSSPASLRRHPKHKTTGD